MSTDQPIETAGAKAQVEGDPSKSTLPEERSFIVNRPGQINKVGGYVGCALLQFSSPLSVNDFFKEHANLLVVDIWVTPMPYAITVLYTNALDNVELEEFNAFSREWSIKKRERDAERAKAERERATKQDAAEAEVRALVEKGKKCRDNHDAVLKQVDELKREVKKLRRQ
jgi:hypothetical protein